MGCSGGGLMRGKGSLKKGLLPGVFWDTKSWIERHSRGKAQAEQRLETERAGVWQKCPRASHASGGLDCM